MRQPGARSIHLAFVLLTALLSVTVTERVTAQDQPLACAEMIVFVREGCPHCARAKTFLEGLTARHPQLAVGIHDIATDAMARKAFAAFNQSMAIDKPGVPTFVFCGEVMIGYGSDDTTGARIESLVTGDGQTPRD